MGAATAHAGTGLFVALVRAGVVEGATLGWFQAQILCRVVPGLATARWTVATAGAAAVAWSVGLTPSFVGAGLATWALPVLLLLWAAAGGLVGAVVDRLRAVASPARSCRPGRVVGRGLQARVVAGLGSG